jgi:hypothetical protein
VNTGNRKAKANTLPMVMRAPPTSAPPRVMLSFLAVASASSTVFVPMSVCDSTHACSFPPSAPTFSCKPGKLWLKCAAWVRMKYDSPAAQHMASSTARAMATTRFRPVARQEVHQRVQQQGQQQREEQGHHDGLRLHKAINERDQAQHDERELLVHRLDHMRMRGCGGFVHGARGAVCIAAPTRYPVKIPVGRSRLSPVLVVRSALAVPRSFPVTILTRPQER